MKKMALLTALVIGMGISAETAPLESKIIAPQSGALFGTAVSIDNTNLFSGAYQAYAPLQGGGWMYCLSNGVWALQWQAEGAVDHDSFGNAVMLSGTDLVVGVFNAHGGLGANGEVWVTSKSGNNWGGFTVFSANCYPPYPNGYAQFGCSVGISGDYIIAGANQDDAPLTNCGSAFIYKRTAGTWANQIKIVPSDSKINALFGKSVSISGDYALIGSSGYNTNTGKAYIYYRNGTNWNKQADLIAIDGMTNDYFGEAVSIDGDFAVVGSKGNDSAGKDAGATYIFIRNGTNWSQDVKLTGAGTSNALFGCSVFLKKSQLIVGAKGDASKGSAFVYNRLSGVWTQTYKLTASDGKTNDAFGYSVSMSSNLLAVGAGGGDAVYVYDVTDTDGDGLPEWWELLYFNNITNADPNADPNLDGRSNLSEYLSGSNPTNLVANGNRYVSPTGFHQPPYTNWWGAANDIQSAVNAAVDGEMIIVKEGTYLGHGNCDLTINGKNISVISESGATSTILDGGGLASCISFTGAITNCLFDGFTIQNCSYNESKAASGSNGIGGLITVSDPAAPVIDHCIIKSNTVTSSNIYAQPGLVVFSTYRPAVMRNCLIINNSISGGTSSLGGMACLLRSEGDTGVRSNYVHNCTFANNALPSGNARLSLYYYRGELANVIDWNNTGAVNVATNPSARYFNTLSQTTYGSGVVSNNPMFASGGTNTFLLSTGSPCIDVGTNMLWMITSTDLGGYSRIANGTVDIGASEYGFTIGLRFSAIDVTWNSASGVTYQVQSCTNLISPSWTNVSSSLTATGSSSYVPDWIRDNKQKFYRVIIP